MQIYALQCSKCGHIADPKFKGFRPFLPNQPFLGLLIPETDLAVPVHFGIVWCEGCSKFTPRLSSLPEREIFDLLIDRLTGSDEYEMEAFTIDKAWLFQKLLSSRREWANWLLNNEQFTTRCVCGSTLLTSDWVAPKMHRGCGGFFDSVDTGIHVSTRSPVEVSIYAYDVQRDIVLDRDGALSLLGWREADDDFEPEHEPGVLSHQADFRIKSEYKSDSVVLNAANFAFKPWGNIPKKDD